MILTQKQVIASKYLGDDHTEEVLFGGGAGGGKSAYGALWLLDRCTKLPGTRWLMGRSRLKTLKDTTLVSFFDVCTKLKIPSTYYNYNQQKSVITFLNGSEILLKDLFSYPSDPNFDELGSLEITGAFIDEVNQISVKARNIVKSRIRYKLNDFTCYGEATEGLDVMEYDENQEPCKWMDSKGRTLPGLVPKSLYTCNPAKNWVYSDFYKPSRDNELPTKRKFIQALLLDNKHISGHYRESLLGLDEVSKQRLLYGNWEYDDDPTKLVNYDSIIDTFTNSQVEKGTTYITADIARLGSDKAVIMVWEGWRVIHIKEFAKSRINEIQEEIEDLIKTFNVPYSRIIADEDGVGGGLIDYMKGIKGFVNGSKALNDENYMNLKSQCYYKLSKRINDGGLYIAKHTPSQKTAIIEELEQVKSYKIDSDSKLRVMPKDKVKELLGRSPDYSDTLMMRAWFDLVPEKQIYRMVF